MVLRVCTSLEEVLEAWGMVYRQYLAAGFIEENPFGLYTFPQYISTDTVVITGWKEGKMVSTVSVVVDSGQGIPLDSFYQRENDLLRQKGQPLMEIGLNVVEGECTNREVMDMLIYAARYSWPTKTRCVIGIHPRREKLFERFFGFQKVGDLKAYENLDGSPPVMMMAANLFDAKSHQFPALAAILNDPQPHLFESRFNFEPSLCTLSQLDQFMQAIWKMSAFMPSKSQKFHAA
jgi:hypothetical protein